MKISMVIPCYNSENTIEKVVKRISAIFNDCSYDYEIILINDCSKDHTWDKIKELAKYEERIKGLSFSKNFGQHSAIMAGFRKSSGDIIMSCDDDGQTPVENIPNLVNKLIEGSYDVVSAKYVGFENKAVFRRMGTVLYHVIQQVTMEVPRDIELRVFFASRRFVIEEICKYDQPYTSINGLIFRVTHNIGNIEMLQHARRAGKSGYSFRKLVHIWLNAFTAFSIVPLRIAGALGLIVSAFGGIGFIVILIRKILYPSIQAGWSSTVAFILLMSGIQLFVFGILGEYIGRIYMCINGTPQYVIQDSTDMGESTSMDKDVI